MASGRIQVPLLVNQFGLSAQKSRLRPDSCFLPIKNYCGTDEWAKKKAVKKELELLRQKQKEQEEAMKTQERSFWEHIAQLKKKWEVERQNFLRESEKMLQHKLKVSLHGTW